jgi:YVTN family beta-propeller protein
MGLPVGSTGLAVDPTGPYAGYVYVGGMEGVGTVSVIKPATNAVVATIDGASRSPWLAASPTGPEAGDVYVDPGELSVSS